MKRLLSANIQVWHLLVAIAFIAVVTMSGVVLAVPFGPTAWRGKIEAIIPVGFAPAGTFRMATAASNVSVTVHAADGEVVVLSTGFNVPSGKRVDVAGFFNAEAYKYPNGYCYLNFHIDTLATDPIKPGQLWVADGYVYAGAYPTISAQGFKDNIAAGTHTLYVTISATGGDCFLDDRSLILMANEHD